jgi:hypothetical protein
LPGQPGQGAQQTSTQTQPPAQQQGNSGFQYKLFDGTKQVDGPGTLNWVVSSNTITGKTDSPIADTENAADVLCRSGQGKLNGVILTGGSVGELKLRAIIYAPTRSGSMSNPRINISCFVDSGSIRYKDIIANSNAILENTAKENTLTAGQTRIAESYNLNGLKKLVEDKLLCIDGTSTSTTFYWNGNEIAGKLG